MDNVKIVKIKTAVKQNFDLSSEKYRIFEETYGFFHRLNERLLQRMEVPESAYVLDVGCGTGASTRQILHHVPNSRIWGLDYSAEMLNTARKTKKDHRLTFVHGDASELSKHFHFPFDAVIYGASIFLIPDYEQSLVQARDLLKQNGRLGLTFMDGVYDPAGNNALAVADQKAQLGVSLKKPVVLDDFYASFQSLFPKNQCWTEDFCLSPEELMGFFSVPAMAAGIFPTVPQTERIDRIRDLFAHINVQEVLFRWKLMVGIKA